LEVGVRRGGSGRGRVDSEGGAEEEEDADPEEEGVDALEAGYKGGDVLEEEGS
jgi:hypothetical protein